MTENNEYLSLFDYQGRPDKEKIGKQVYDYAKFKKIKVKSRELENGKKVMLYPKLFLAEYFFIKKVCVAPIKCFI